MTQVMTYPKLYDPPFPYRSKAGTYTSMTGTPESNAAVPKNSNPMSFQMEYTHGVPLKDGYHLNGGQLGFTCDDRLKKLFIGASFFGSDQKGNDRGIEYSLANALPISYEPYKTFYGDGGVMVGLQPLSGKVPLNIELSSKMKFETIRGKSTLSLLFGGALSTNILGHMDVGVRVSDLGLSHVFNGQVFKQDSNVSVGAMGYVPIRPGYLIKIGADYTNYWWSTSQDVLTGVQADMHFPKPNLALSLRAAYSWKDSPGIAPADKHDVVASIRLEKILPYMGGPNRAKAGQQPEETLERHEKLYIDLSQGGIIPLIRKKYTNPFNRPETKIQFGLKSEI